MQSTSVPLSVSFALGSLGFFVALLVALELGWRLGARRRANETVEENELQWAVGPVVGAVFALLGLLIAFTFSGAASRFDGRRQLIGQESNAIGTAYLRLDLLPTDAQPELRAKFREYVDARLATFEKLPDVTASHEERLRSEGLQRAIWNDAVAATRVSPPHVAIVLLPALNAMIDITTTRLVAVQTHPPTVVFVMLIAIALISAVLAGYGMSTRTGRSWFHMLGYAVVMAVTVFVILNIEYPRLGVIRVDAADQILRDLRESMN